MHACAFVLWRSDSCYRPRTMTRIYYRICVYHIRAYIYTPTRRIFLVVEVVFTYNPINPTLHVVICSVRAYKVRCEFELRIPKYFPTYIM